MPVIEIAAFLSFFALVATWLAAPSAKAGAAVPAVSPTVAASEA